MDIEEYLKKAAPKDSTAKSGNSFSSTEEYLKQASPKKDWVATPPTPGPPLLLPLLLLIPYTILLSFTELLLSLSHF